MGSCIGGGGGVVVIEKILAWTAIAVTLGGCIPLWPADAALRASGSVADGAGKIYAVCRIEPLMQWQLFLSSKKKWGSGGYRIESGKFATSFTISPDDKETIIEVSCRGAKGVYRSPIFSLTESRDIDLGHVVLERATTVSLQEAVCGRNIGQTKLALATGEDPNAIFTEGFGKGHTPLTLALASTDCKGPVSLEIVSLLVENRADVNKKSNTRLDVTPLFEAVGSSNVQAVEYLVQKGADVNARNTLEKTPLLDVAENRSEHAYKIAEVLLKAGADPHAESFTGETADVSAERWDQPDIAELIRRAKQKK